MRPEDFDLFAGTVKQQAGIVLTADKAYLLESRLPPVARKWGFKTIDELAKVLRARRDSAMMDEIAEAMATKESFFFRDPSAFEQLRNVLLPQFLKARAGKKQLRIWSAAASSGQEAYSLAMMCAEEAAVLQGWKIDIIGSDFSSEMIERAKSGLYSQFEVQRGLPVTMLVKYFQQDGDKWQVRDAIRSMAQFRTGNLLHNFGPVGVFDIIFCRNVLESFDPPTQMRVLDALASVLAPDGALFLGGAEAVPCVAEKFRPLANGSGIYMPANAKGAMRAAG